MNSFGFDVVENTVPRRITNNKASFTYEYKTRLERTTIECDDALKVITRYDSTNTFHYVDPPYYNSNCGIYKGYTEQDFKNLLDTLSTIKGKFLLSSYPSEILNEYISKFNWHTKVIEQKVSVNSKRKSNQTKTEVLTANYPIA